MYADGLCEPRNPGGVACYGFVAWRGDERIAEGWGVACRGRAATNNVAEYAAAQAALERLLEMGLEGEVVEVRSDSQLLVRQMSGLYAVRSPRIAESHRALSRLASRFRGVRWRWVPRVANREADALSRRAYAEDVARRADGLRVREAGDGQFLVLSSRGHTWYKVQVAPERCECPAFARGARPCKHVVAVRRYREAPSSAERGTAQRENMEAAPAGSGRPAPAGGHPGVGGRLGPGYPGPRVAESS